MSCNLLKPQLFGGGGTWQEHGAAGGTLGLTSSLQAEWLILLRWESRTALSLLAPQIIDSEHHFTLTLRGAGLFHVVLPPHLCSAALPPRGWKGLLTPDAVFGGERACWGGHLDASLNLYRQAEGI